MAWGVISGIIGLLALGGVYEWLGRRRDARLPLPGRMVEVDGRRLHVTEAGSAHGGPTVVIIPGAGDSSYSWAYVRKAVAESARVVCYDRPGLGSSDPGPGPDPVRSVAELHELLAKTGAPAPYLLVGHSLGGLIARLYAIRYPEQVAGMVFVDSTHEDLQHDAKFKQGYAALGMMLKLMKGLSIVGLPRFLGQVLKLMPMYADERPYYEQQVSQEEYRQWAAAFYRNLTSQSAALEFESAFPMIAAADALRTTSAEGPQFSDLPMVVLSNPGFGDHWIAMHQELAGRSANAVHKVSDRKGHSLQMPRPDLVIQAIADVAEQARSRSQQVS